MVGVVIVLVLAAVGVAAWSISRSLHHSPAAAPSQSSSSVPVASPACGRPAQARQRQRATTRRPATSNDDDPGDAQNAIDGNASTSWHTSYYFSPPRSGT